MVVEQETDKIEDAKTDETLAWIEEEERREKEAIEATKKAQQEKDEQWMLEQLKKEQGDNFGEDLNLDFGE